MRNKNQKEKIDKKVNELLSFKAFKTDPDGSYTGTPKDETEVPQQDADDL